MNTVTLKHVSKKYRKNLQSFRSIFEYLLGIKSKDDFLALDDINIEIKKGKTLGIIGKNGSGKSTLLKVIAGITIPHKGTRNIFGKIVPLIEIGAGFQPELTGRENIHFYGAILGIKRSFLRENIDKIVEFSGIQKMIDTPVKFYSSGMHARLSFAITAYAKPDILIIDEVMAVGDTDFQNRCYKKIEELKISGTTIIIVSHNMEVIQKNCDDVLVLEQGKVIFIGRANDAINIYMRQSGGEHFKYIPFNDHTKYLKVNNFNITNQNNKITLSFDYKNTNILNALWGLNIYTKNSVNLISSHGPKLEEKGKIKASIDTTIFNNDSYLVEFSVFGVNPFIHYGNTGQITFEITHNNKILPGVLNDTMLSW